MPVATGATWECPRCRRRVPRRVEVCHCGLKLAQIEAFRTAAPPGSEKMPWDVWAGLIFLVLVLVTGIAQLFRRWEPTRIHPLLGYAEAKPPGAPKAPVRSPGPGPRPLRH